MVFTRRFLWFLLAGIPIAGIAALLGAPAVAVAYNVLLFAAAYITFRLMPRLDGLTVTRKFDPLLSVRADNKVRLILNNEGAEPIRGIVRDEPPEFFPTSNKPFPFLLQSEEPLEFQYTVTPQERGLHQFRGTFLRLDCPFGLVTRDVFLANEEPVRVYPNLLALREFDLLKQQGRLREIGIRRTRNRGIGMEFESLRDYGDGDDFRKIDHKASARRGKLVVRQYETERNQVVMITIDIGRHMLAEVNGVRKLDYVLDSLLMLTNAAAMAGDLVGLLVYSDQVRRYLPPRKGRAQVGAIIEACHDLVSEPVESDPVAAFSYLATRWKRRSLLVSFTDYEDPDRAKELLSAYVPLARRHLALIARVLDPRLAEVTEKTIETPQDMFAVTAAGILSEDRQKATMLMTSAGIQNLESEPQDLAASLVTFYFRVKERALL